MNNTFILYSDLQERKPRALAYLRLLQKRYEQGKQAEAILNALKAMHDTDVRIRELGPLGGPVSIGAVPGGYLTPNGRVLTQEAMSQLVAVCYAAANR